MTGLRGYDQWLTTQPEPVQLPLPGEQAYPRCGRCGGFLRRDPDPALTRYGELRERCDGQPGEFMPDCTRRYLTHEPHDVIVQAWTIWHRPCKRCGYDNQEVD